nr:amidase [Gammaproteobacteria bacterium]
MTCHNILLKSALEQAELIRSREISARELLELHVRQYKKHHDQINAVIFTRLEEARATADQLDEELRKGAPRGPLHGVTMTVKDSYDLLGTPSTWGIPEFRANFPDTDSLAVTRLKEAGLVIYGKTNVPYR